MLEPIDYKDIYVEGLGILCDSCVTSNGSLLFRIFQFNHSVGMLLVKLDSDFNIVTYEMLYRDELHGSQDTKTELDNAVGIIQLDKSLNDFVEENKIEILLHSK